MVVLGLPAAAQIVLGVAVASFVAVAAAVAASDVEREVPRWETSGAVGPTPPLDSVAPPRLQKSKTGG